MSKINYKDDKVFSKILEDLDGDEYRLGLFIQNSLTNDIDNIEGLPNNIINIHKCDGYLSYVEAKIKWFKKIQYEHIELTDQVDNGFMHGVFKLGDKYYRADWEYYSYRGYCYRYEDEILERLREVQPTERVVIDYV